VSLGADMTALVWDVSQLPRKQRPKAAALGVGEFRRLWDDLAGADAAHADEAIHRLAVGREQAVGLMRDRLEPVRFDGQRVATLVTDLESRQYRVRSHARTELERLGECAAPALRAALSGKPPLETRRVVEELLEKISRRELTPEQTRSLRALEVLEQVGTPGAVRLLETLAKGAPEALLTREAKASLSRLAKQPPR
jgi:hypothetical protein